MSAEARSVIRVFGVDWCRDCRRAKAVLNKEGIEYDYIDLESNPYASDIAQEISGSQRIPVVTYPDGSHQSEPGMGDIRAKLAELGLIPSPSAR